MLSGILLALSMLLLSYLLLDGAWTRHFSGADDMKAVETSMYVLIEPISRPHEVVAPMIDPMNRPHEVVAPMLDPMTRPHKMKDSQG